MILNNELRNYPLVSRLDGVGFVDIGNVYRHVSDISLTDIRKAAGLGLRVRTPWFLLRLDYGLKLGRRPGESVRPALFQHRPGFLSIASESPEAATLRIEMSGRRAAW